MDSLHRSLADSTKISIIPFLKRQVTNSTFAICLLAQLYDASEFYQGGGIPKDLVQKAFSELLADVVAAYTLEFHNPPTPPTRASVRHHTTLVTRLRLG